jgi:hypothetical protein
MHEPDSQGLNGGPPHKHIDLSCICSKDGIDWSMVLQFIDNLFFSGAGAGLSGVKTYTKWHILLFI